MKTIPHRHHAAGKRKIRQRLDRPVTAPSPEPVFTASNIHYEVADQDPGHRLRRHRRHPPPGPQARPRRGHRRALHLLKFHLPYHEIRPRPQLRLQRPVRRHLPRRHRTAPQRRRLPRRPRRRRIPDPTTAGDFCRRFTADDVETLQDVFDQTRRQGLGTAAARLLRRGRHRHRRHPGRHRRRLQAGHGHRLRRHLGLSPADRLAGQHRRGAQPRQPLRQPALARGRRRADSTWRSCSAARPASAASTSAATPTSPRPSSSTPGTPRA